jgi:hypothetical protein
MWKTMRSKLIIIVTAVVFIVLVKKYFHSQDHDLAGAYISGGLLRFTSIAEIENKFHGMGFTSTSKQEAWAGNEHFVFFDKYPYRGIPVTGVYCYEQIRTNEWILRGFFPVNAWYSQSNDGKNTNGLDYAEKSDSVNVIYNGTVLFSIKSMALTMEKSVIKGDDLNKK